MREAIRALLVARYPDFGPTLAQEKLHELHRIEVSVETVRQLQVELGLWRPKRRKAARAFQLRERRGRFGELIQIDGSPHDGFEGRGPRCTLIVFIDDATGRLVQWWFAPSETTAVYHVGAAPASGTVRATGGALLRPPQHLPHQPGRARQRRHHHPVRTRLGGAGDRGDPRPHPAGQGSRRTRQPDPPGPFSQGVTSARHQRHGERQRLPPHVHGRLQPALRGGPQRRGRRPSAPAPRPRARWTCCCRSRRSAPCPRTSWCSTATSPISCVTMAPATACAGPR